MIVETAPSVPVVSDSWVTVDLVVSDEVGDEVELVNGVVFSAHGLKFGIRSNDQMRWHSPEVVD